MLLLVIDPIPVDHEHEQEHEGEDPIVPILERTVSPSDEMELLTHPIGFGQPGFHLGIDVLHALEPEGVQMISRRERFDAEKTGIFPAAREHNVPIDPVPSNNERGEAHPNLKRNPGLLWEHGDRPVSPGDTEQLVEDRADGRRLSSKMSRERGQAARVRLIAVGKPAAALRATPHRWWIVRSAARCFFTRLCRHF